MRKRFPTDHHQDGLGDIVQSFFFSPKEPVGGWILGFGPALLYPSATDDKLGTEKWAAGPTLVALKQTGPWTVGVLANHLWSYAGDEDRRSVNSTFVQPFVSYITKTKTTFTLNSESTYDWNESQWTVPLNATVSQLVKLGPAAGAIHGRRTLLRRRPERRARSGDCGSLSPHYFPPATSPRPRRTARASQNNPAIHIMKSTLPSPSLSSPSAAFAGEPAKKTIPRRRSRTGGSFRCPRRAGSRVLPAMSGWMESSRLSM